MALTISKTRSGVVGDLRYFAGTVTFDSSYPTGGEAITPANFWMTNSLVSVIVNPADDAGVEVKWAPSTSKLLVFVEDNVSGISAEAGNGTDQSGVVVPVFVLGI